MFFFSFVGNSTDSFSEEEDEFIMAEDNNHAAENEIDQEDIRNLHIDGKIEMDRFDEWIFNWNFLHSEIFCRWWAFCRCWRGLEIKAEKLKPNFIDRICLSISHINFELETCEARIILRIQYIFMKRIQYNNKIMFKKN